MKENKDKPCHCCEGSGKEQDDIKTGRALSGLRLRKGIGLRSMARRLSISHSYLCLLEHGLRKWDKAQVARYMEELG